MFKNVAYTALFLIALVALFLACGESTKPEETPTGDIIISIESEFVNVGEQLSIIAEVIGAELDSAHTVEWAVSAGTIDKTSELEVIWTAPDDTLSAAISASVKIAGLRYEGGVAVHVGNQKPQITGYISTSDHVLLGNTLTLTCTATDPEGYTLTYNYYTVPDSGILLQSDNFAATATWTAPAEESFVAKPYLLIVEVSDAQGSMVADTIQALVYADDRSIWVVDSGSNLVSKFTSNGHKILTSEQEFLNPVAVATNTNESFGCYVADYDAGTIYKLDAEGRTLVTYADIPTVIDLAVHKETRTIWALSAGESAVHVIDGFQDLTLKTIYGFNQPQFVHINQATGDVWIAEPGNHRLLQLRATGSAADLPDSVGSGNVAIFPGESDKPFLNSPYSPFVQNLEGNTLYLADRGDGEIERLQWNGSSYERMATPVSIDGGAPRFVSVADLPEFGAALLSLTVDGRLYIHPESDIDAPVALSGTYEFDAPYALTLDENTGEFWIGDNGSNQMVKIRINPDYTFTTISEINGFVFIDDAALND